MYRRLVLLESMRSDVISDSYLNSFQEDYLKSNHVQKLVLILRKLNINTAVFIQML